MSGPQRGHVQGQGYVWARSESGLRRDSAPRRSFPCERAGDVSQGRSSVQGRQGRRVLRLHLRGEQLTVASGCFLLM